MIILQKKIEMFYLISILILALLVLYIGYVSQWHLRSEKAPKVHSILEYTSGENAGIVAFKIYNVEDKDEEYIYMVWIDEELIDNKTIFIPKARSFSYMRLIKTDKLEDNTTVNIVIYNSREKRPIENATYFIKKGTSTFCCN